MRTLYKITDRVWGISDMPWPFFYGLQGLVFLKLIVGTIILCLVTLTYPILYVVGVWYLIKKKKKPNWLYFALYTGLMGWYIFCIVKYLVLGYPIKRYSDWPGGDKPAVTRTLPEYKEQADIVWIGDTPVRADDILEVNEEGVTARHFRLTIRDPEYQYDWLNRHRVEQNLPPLKLSSRQIKNLRGTYAWDSTIMFETQAQLLNYVCTHYDEMQKFKGEVENF